MPTETVSITVRIASRGTGSRGSSYTAAFLAAYARFVPKADILRCGKERRYSMTLSARANSVAGTMMPNAPAVLG